MITHATKPVSVLQPGEYILLTFPAIPNYEATSLIGEVDSVEQDHTGTYYVEYSYRVSGYSEIYREYKMFPDTATVDTVEIG